MQLAAVAVGIFGGARRFEGGQKQEASGVVEARCQLGESAEARLAAAVGRLARLGVGKGGEIFGEVGLPSGIGDPAVGVVLEDVVVAQAKKMVAMRPIPFDGLFGKDAPIRPEGVRMEVPAPPACVFRFASFLLFA